MNLTNYRLQSVTLNVHDLAKMTTFYTEIIGLTSLKKTATSVHLGSESNAEALLILEETHTPSARTSGLYHVAYLLPSRQALGEFLTHLIQTQYPVEGASDHGYSEAVYLADPEGNGIEVYHDKPKASWDLRAGGIIVGVTEPMDLEGVLGAAKSPFTALAAETMIGHVHLAVSSIAPTDEFFVKVLNFTLTTKFGEQASFYGKDGYHHQFAGNIWQSRNLPNKTDDLPGLREIRVRAGETVMTETLEQLKEHGLSHAFHGSDLVFHDPNGIKFIYQAQ